MKHFFLNIFFSFSFSKDVFAQIEDTPGSERGFDEDDDAGPGAEKVEAFGQASL